jgi:predicted DNA-binding protein (UPF0251 family)/predicted Fe-Mo cluster-binding NifX family protein
MSRHRKRRLSSYFLNNVFKPKSSRIRIFKEVIILEDEFEAVRLKDFCDLDQNQAAKQMQISQPTFHRLIKAGRKKIIDALINGKILRVKGENVIMKKNEKTIVAIAAKEKDIKSEIDPLFGRAPYFVVFSVKDNEIENYKILENKILAQAGQAGISTAKMLIELGVEFVICGNVGPRALDVLEQFDVKVFTRTGLVKDALESFVNEKLK